jgi:hypothetical protein
MSPMTPGTISSLLNSIGRGGIRCIALLRLHPCASIAIEVEDSENVIPTMIPTTISRVNRVGNRRRCHTLENMSVHAISRQSLDDMVNRNLEMQMTIRGGQLSQARLLCLTFRDGVVTVACFLIHSTTSRHIQHSLRYASLDRISPLLILIHVARITTRAAMPGAPTSTRLSHRMRHRKPGPSDTPI